MWVLRADLKGEGVGAYPRRKREKCLFPLIASQVSMEGEGPSHRALGPECWLQRLSQAAVSVLSQMGSIIHFQLGGLLLLLRAEIWVTNDVGKSSFLDITVWVVWGGEDVERGKGNQEQLEVYVAEESQVHQQGPGRRAAVQTLDLHPVV